MKGRKVSKDEQATSAAEHAAVEPLDAVEEPETSRGSDSAVRTIRFVVSPPTDTLIAMLIPHSAKDFVFDVFTLETCYLTHM